MNSSDESTKKKNTDLKFTFFLDHDRFETDASGYFETGLDRIKKHYQDKLHFKNCYGCMYGDYSYAGNAMFGSMCCFRKNKPAYIVVSSKLDYERLFPEGCESGFQEIYYCDEFEIRKKGVGYRG